MYAKSILRICGQNYPFRPIRNTSVTSLTRHLTSVSGDIKCAPEDLFRHRYHNDSEYAVNNQITTELNAAYIYLAMAAHFGRTEIALPGCYAFFFQMHLEELGHAHKLIRYQNMRGGKVTFCGLQPVKDMESMNISQSFEKGLKMEKDVKEKLEDVVRTAEKHKDFSLADFIVADYIQAQEKSIQEYARLLQRHKNMGCGNCGCVDFLFDKELHREFTKSHNEDEIKLTSIEKAFK